MKWSKGLQLIYDHILFHRSLFLLSGLNFLTVYIKELPGKSAKRHSLVGEFNSLISLYCLFLSALKLRGEHRHWSMYVRNLDSTTACYFDDKYLSPLPSKETSFAALVFHRSRILFFITFNQRLTSLQIWYPVVNFFTSKGSTPSKPQQSPFGKKIVSM